MVYLLKRVIFHGYVSHNQMVPWIDPGPLLGIYTSEVEALDMSIMMVTLNGNRTTKTTYTQKKI